MPIFGNPIEIIVGTSGSSNTGSLGAINFQYINPEYGSSPLSSSIGSIAFTNPSSGSGGAAGTFTFNVFSPESGSGKPTPALTVGATGVDRRTVIGIGLKPDEQPLKSLDIRSVSASGDDAQLLLRTNNDGTIEAGEETGRITFAIESGSLSADGGKSAAEFIASGSTSAIFSRVKSVTGEGAYGNLHVQVNDASSTTDPVDILELGYGATARSSTNLGAKFSASLEAKSSAPYLDLNYIDGTNVAYLGFNTPVGFTQGILRLFDNAYDNPQIQLTANGNSWISGSNAKLGIGVQSPSSVLDVSGSVNIEGSITASGDISASGNVYVFNTLGRKNSLSYIDFYPGNVNNDISIVTNNSESLRITTDGEVSASGLFFASASEGPGDDLVLTYSSASGQFFFTASSEVGGAATTPTLQQVTDQSPETTAALTASIFSASGGGVISDNISSSIYHYYGGSPQNYGIVISASQQFIDVGGVSGGIGLLTLKLWSQGAERIEVGGSGITSYTKILDQGLYVSGNISSSNNISAVNEITASGTISGSNVYGTLHGNSNSFIFLGDAEIDDRILFNDNGSYDPEYIQVGNDIILSSGSNGITLGPNTNYTRINGIGVTVNAPLTASIISASGTVTAASFNIAQSNVTTLSASIVSASGDVSGLNVVTQDITSSGTISGSDLLVVGGITSSYITNAQSLETNLLSIAGDTSLQVLSGKLAIGNNRSIQFNKDILSISSSGNISGSSLHIEGGATVTGTGSLASLILAPTSSGVPTWTGEDGQMVVGSIGSDHYIFVYMANQWRSSSLA